MSNAVASNRASQKAMNISKRVVNARRHTMGYIVNGQRHSVAQVRQLVSSGRIRNVQVVGNHIQATPGSRRLSDLPVQVIRN